jgi:hypothetical protein
MPRKGGGGGAGGRIPIAKSTGLPDRRYSTDGRHGGGSGGIPIAKSTGLPDRRYSIDGRHGGGSGGIPIAKSTGLPDRRYSTDGRHSGGGSGLMAAAKAEAAAAALQQQMREHELLYHHQVALQQQMREHELYHQQLVQVQPQDLFRVNEDQRDDEDVVVVVDDDDTAAAGSSMPRHPAFWPQPLDIPGDVDTAEKIVPLAFICRISHEIMREPALVCVSGHTYDRVHLTSWHASSSGQEPLTRQPFALTDMAPNLALRELIYEWIQDHKSRQLEEVEEEEEEEEEKEEELAAAAAGTEAKNQEESVSPADSSAQEPSLEVQQSLKEKQVGPSIEEVGLLPICLNTTCLPACNSSDCNNTRPSSLPAEEDIASAVRALESRTEVKEQEKAAAAEEEEARVVVVESASMAAAGTDDAARTKKEQNQVQNSAGAVVAGATLALGGAIIAGASTDQQHGDDGTKQLKVEVSSTDAARTRKEKEHNSAGAVAAGAAALAVGGAILAGGLVAGALRPQARQKHTLGADDLARDRAGHVCKNVEETVVEYQRKIPFKGFSARHLFPNEPALKRGNVALASKEDLVLPDCWRWKDDWCVVTGSAANAPGTDKDGWMYAFNWGSDYAASAKMTDCIRRRIWKRTRERVAE